MAQSNDTKTNYSKLYYMYEGDIYEVSEQQIVHDGRGYNKTNSYRDDLIIYKLDECYNSFKFYEGQLDDSQKICSRVYDYDEDKNIMKTSYITSYYKGQSYIQKHTNNEKVCYKNCYYVKCQYPGYKYGNSGCALFVKDVLYGILLAMNDYGKNIIDEIENYTILDAKYIKECIDKCEAIKKKRNL